MAKRAIKLHDKRTLHVYSNSPQDLKDWLEEFNWLTSHDFIEIRQRLLNDGVTELLKANATWADLYQAQKQRVANGDIAPPQAALAYIEPLENALKS